MNEAAIPMPGVPINKRQFPVKLKYFAIVFVGLIVYFGQFYVVTHGVDYAYDHIVPGANVLQQVNNNYQRINIPSLLTPNAKTQTGDPVDDPADLGWEYNYTSSASPTLIFDRLQTNLEAAGYQISDIKTAANNPQLYPAVYTFYAGNQAANMSLNVAINAPRNTLKVISISATRFNDG